MKYRVGTSGWNYETFIGIIYDRNTPKRRYLETYCRYFDTVELNASFYRTFTDKTWAGWYQRTPEGFVWSVKAPRFMTHVRRLRVEKESLDAFCRKVYILKEKLGPLLFQLPPSLEYEPDTLASFLTLLPGGLRVAIEPRNETWFDQEVFDRLHDRNVALVISDSCGRYPSKEAFTADFVYLRLHGATGLYRGEYGESGLAKWAGILRRSGLDAYVYFDNTDDGSAAKDALLMKKILEGEPSS